MSHPIRVRTWQEAHERLGAIIGQSSATLGSGYTYPEPFAYFSTDALSGEGMGYRVYTTARGRLDRLVATIRIGPHGDGGHER